MWIWFSDVLNAYIALDLCSKKKKKQKKKQRLCISNMCYISSKCWKYLFDPVFDTPWPTWRGINCPAVQSTSSVGLTCSEYNFHLLLLSVRKVGQLWNRLCITKLKLIWCLCLVRNSRRISSDEWQFYQDDIPQYHGDDAINMRDHTSDL
jgi:hypothetical protein